MFEGKTLTEWVDYIQTLHAREIDLSLDRVREVYTRLCPEGLPFTVISVAGTNGKGSTTEILRSIYQAAGFKAAKFTSPHLIDFSERFQVDGANASDQALLKAFKKIEQCRGDVPITYFEYCLLLAVVIFVEQNVDVAIMEVGLGGRLDATNVLDADVSVISSIALDHTAWLGDTLEQIAFEKAGIARSNRPCVVGVRQPQQSMLSHLESIDAPIKLIGKDFDYQQNQSDTWTFKNQQQRIESIALPFRQTGVQLSNASLAIQVVAELQNSLPVDAEQIKLGVAQASILGRCQIIDQHPLTVLDVSHNEASLARLSEFVSSLDYPGRTIAICGMLKDKEIVASLEKIAPLVDIWSFATIEGERGSTSSYLHQCLTQLDSTHNKDSVHLYDNVVDAYENVSTMLTKDDCLVVFGSFYIAGDILRHLADRVADGSHG